MSSDLELLTSFFVDIWTRENGVTLDSSWQWNWTVHFGVRALCCIYNFESALIQYSMIVSFHTDSNNFMRTGHSVHHSLKNLKRCQFNGNTAAKTHAARGREKDKEEAKHRQSQIFAFTIPSSHLCPICRTEFTKAAARVTNQKAKFSRFLAVSFRAQRSQQSSEPIIPTIAPFSLILATPQARWFVG